MLALHRRCNDHEKRQKHYSLILWYTRRLQREQGTQFVKTQWEIYCQQHIDPSSVKVETKNKVVYVLNGEPIFDSPSIQEQNSRHLRKIKRTTELPGDIIDELIESLNCTKKRRRQMMIRRRNQRMVMPRKRLLLFHTLQIKPFIRVLMKSPRMERLLLLLMERKRVCQTKWMTCVVIPGAKGIYLT